MMVSGILERPTLILNRSWQPVGVAPVSRSLVLLWNDNARVVDPQDYQLYTWSDWSQLIPRDDEPFIQAVRLRLRVPEVVALTHYDRIGVAKTRFHGAQAVEVIRGDSKSPLFVTAIGIDPADAADHIRTMHGSFRISPTRWNNHASGTPRERLARHPLQPDGTRRFRRRCNRRRGR